MKPIRRHLSFSPCSIDDKPKLLYENIRYYQAKHDKVLLIDKKIIGVERMEFVKNDNFGLDYWNFSPIRCPVEVAKGLTNAPLWQPWL